MNELAYSLFRNLVPVFVFIMTGLGLRRLGVVGHKGVGTFTRVVIYFFFPILVFHRIALTENPAEILSNYQVHIWAVIILAGSGLIAVLWHKLTRVKADWRTFIFSVAMPNWIYLPIAIAGPVWGDEATRAIILFNIPTQFILWTAGVRLLRGSIKGTHALRYVFMNPGLIGTGLGILVAVGWIPVTFLEDGKGLNLSRFNGPLYPIGGMAIPLSIVALGMFLGERGEAREGGRKLVFIVTLGRLLVAPSILIPLVIGAAYLGFETPQVTRWVLYMIISMPVAMSVPVFVQLFGGDRYLSSRSVVFSTLAAFITSPLFIVLALKAEVWLGLAESMVLPLR